TVAWTATAFPAAPLATVAATLATASVVTRGLALAAGLLADVLELELAAAVEHVLDLDEHLVADVDRLLGVVEPLAGHLGQLGDVQQPVGAGREAHERAEV